jgi:WD40 repeat protein
MRLDPKAAPPQAQPKEGKTLQLDQQACIVRFSLCGKLLAAGGFDGRVHRWDATTDPLTTLPALTGHNGWVQALAFHPDGKRLFTADTWGRLCCWPYADKQPRPLWNVPQAHDGWVRQAAVSPDGKLLATCGRDAAVRLWSTEDGKKQRELTGRGEDVFCVAFHPDGKSLVSGDLKGAIQQWDLATGKGGRTFDAKVMYRYDRIQDVGGVRCLAFDRAGTTLACGGSEPKSGGFVQGAPLVLLFDWPTGKRKHLHKFGAENDGFVYDLAFHPDGFLMAVTSGQPGSGKLLFHRPGEAQPFFLTTKMANCHSLAVHPQGRRLVVSATNGGSNGNGRLLGKNKEYPGNWSPLHIWELPADGA